MTQTSLIHPTAVVDRAAEIDETVRIGPFTVIEAGVSIESGTTVGPHVHLQGITEIGPDTCEILPAGLVGRVCAGTDYWVTGADVRVDLPTWRRNSLRDKGFQRAAISTP